MAQPYPEPNGTPEEPTLRGMLELVPDLVSDDPAEVAVTLRDRYGYVVRIPGLHPALDGDVYLVSHPDDVQRILQTEPSRFGPLDVPGSRDFGRVVRNSVVSLSPDSEEGSWTQRTRMLSPEFAARAVGECVPDMAETTLATLAEFEAGPGDGDPTAVPTGARVWPPGGGPGVVSLAPAMRRLSLRLLGVSLFGTDVRAHEAQVIDAVTTLRAEFKRRQLNLVAGRLTRHLPDELHLPGFLQGHLGDPSIRLNGRQERRTRRAIEELVTAADAIAARRERTPLAFGDGPATWLVRPDPVTGETLSPEVLRQELVGLLVAGHATTSAALTWAFYLLATRPGVQERIHDEARETALLASLADARDRDHSIWESDSGTSGAAFLDALAYTRRVWQETLRLYPALPLFGRTTKEPVTLGGTDVPVGSHVLVSPFVTHRDPAFWTDPERFDPDRFTPDRTTARPEFAYYPFSGGRHACLGEQVATAEVLVVLATTLATHRVEVVEAGATGTTDEERGGDGPARSYGPHRSESGYGPAPGVDSAINLQPDREIRLRFVPRA